MRVAVAVALALLIGFVAFAGLVSDIGPRESLVTRVAYLSVLFLGGGLLVGLLVGRYWWLAVLCAWTVQLRLAVLLVHGLRGAPGGPLSPEIGEVAAQAAFAAGLSLLGSFLGASLRGRMVGKSG